MPISKAGTENALWLLAAGLALLAAGCASQKPATSRYSQSHDSGPRQLIDVTQIKDAVPRDEPPSPYGNPPSYVVLGTRYRTIASSSGYRERGIASWYGSKFHGHRTSNGDIYDMYGMSAAHKSLPLPTYARVTNLQNGKAVVVRINDRGPFHENRLIDLSYAAAAKLGILGKGTGLVEVTALTAPGDDPPPNPARIAPSLPKVASTTSSAAQSPSLYLQLGAFSSRDNAERLQSKLSRLDLPAALHITSGTANDQPVYRVRIGPLDTVESADRLTHRLAAHGFSGPHVVVD